MYSIILVLGVPVFLIPFPSQVAASYFQNSVLVRYKILCQINNKIMRGRCLHSGWPRGQEHLLDHQGRSSCCCNRHPCPRPRSHVTSTKLERVILCPDDGLHNGLLKRGYVSDLAFIIWNHIILELEQTTHKGFTSICLCEKISSKNLWFCFQAQYQESVVIVVCFVLPSPKVCSREHCSTEVVPIKGLSF